MVVAADTCAWSWMDTSWWGGSPYTRGKCRWLLSVLTSFLSVRFVWLKTPWSPVLYWKLWALPVTRFCWEKGGRWMHVILAAHVKHFSSSDGTEPFQVCEDVCYDYSASLTSVKAIPRRWCEHHWKTCLYITLALKHIVISVPFFSKAMKPSPEGSQYQTRVTCNWQNILVVLWQYDVCVFLLTCCSGSVSSEGFQP